MHDSAVRATCSEVLYTIRAQPSPLPYSNPSNGLFGKIHVVLGVPFFVFGFDLCVLVPEVMLS